MSDDPFAELDDLLSEIDKKKAISASNSSAITPSSSASSNLSGSISIGDRSRNPSAPAASSPKVASSSSGNAIPALNADLESLLGEIAAMEIKPVAGSASSSSSTGSVQKSNTATPAQPQGPSSPNQPVQKATATASSPSQSKAPVSSSPSGNTTSSKPVHWNVNSSASPATTSSQQTSTASTSTVASPKPTATSPVASPSQAQPPAPVVASSQPIVIDGKLPLNQEETDLANEINRARQNPREYANILQSDRRPHFNGKGLKIPGTNAILQTTEGVEAVDEAINFLNSVQPLPPFKIALGMTKAARAAVQEVGAKGEFAASRSINKLDDYGTFEVEAVELVSFGTNNSREVVLRFLVGDGNAERTHRKHMYNPDYKCIGVAVGPHQSNFKSMAVINFANGFRDK
eukprot:TRINITY_DN2281_c0_g1_i1.p1 TRINITY_DN2281_c0_g1~~TRINITY_DN2281_c0_g1_i1.p1  ORF type:complete len:405 (+),score=102.81 TRINITY_DN2281_c0_g1_i1:99-1313(+)